MKVLLLAGGESSEREVSLTSGRAVCEALQAGGHEVLAIDPHSGTALLSPSGKFLEAAEVSFPDDAEQLPSVVHNIDQAADDVDIVFIALHGGSGENGSIQNLLDLADVPYTGSGHTAAAVAMDKALTKSICVSLGIPTPRWKLFRVPDGRITPVLHREVTAQFQPPFIVKPNDSGSTVGLTKVDKLDPLTPALIEALGESINILVEEYVAGREMTVSVFDGHALPVVEIKPRSGLYNYEAKYTAGGSEYVCPAPIDTAMALALQTAAVELYQTIGAAGLARVDFLLDGQGNFFCLELNTLPGMTALSLAPMAAKAEGIGFGELVEKILQSGLRRARQ